MVASIGYSSFLLMEKFVDCRIYYYFLMGKLSVKDLTYFIYVRTLVEKESQVRMYDLKSKRYRDVRSFYIEEVQCDHIEESICGFGKVMKINKLKRWISHYNKNVSHPSKTHVYSILAGALYIHTRGKFEKVLDTKKLESQVLDKLKNVSLQ